MRIRTESTPARGVPPEGSPARDLLRNRGMMQKKSLKPLYHAQKKRAQKISLARARVTVLQGVGGSVHSENLRLSRCQQV